MDVYDLGAILKHIGNFDVSEFKGRLILQKTVYLLQSFGIDLGYKFGWYLHGTYCTKLTRDGFELESVIGDIPKLDIKFTDADVQSSYNKYMQFIGDKKFDPDLLEIASSIRYLSRSNFEKEKVLDMVEKKKKQFTRDQCVRIWNELEKCGIVEDEHA